ncbi:hypothetical protein [Pleionea sediminis]|uniref:hypothetical protein n=1 Tax=Pleionea sediminis TaxID=2569479 RepID=UPI0011860994|nr:hypothetical protein [Pleionea sediminis]
MNTDEQKKTWLEVNNAISTACVDAGEEFERIGLDELRGVVERAGIGCIIASIKELSPEDTSFELYWLAKAGFTEVEDELVTLLDSPEEDQVANAAVGLAYLDNLKGFEVIEKMCLGEYRVKLTMSPEWTFLAYLQEINSPKAMQLAKKIISGVYDRWEGS